MIGNFLFFVERENKCLVKDGANEPVPWDDIAKITPENEDVYTDVSKQFNMLLWALFSVSLISTVAFFIKIYYECRYPETYSSIPKAVNVIKFS